MTMMGMCTVFEVEVRRCSAKSDTTNPGFAPEPVSVVLEDWKWIDGCRRVIRPLFFGGRGGLLR